MTLPDHAVLAARIADLQTAKLVCVGDVMLDFFVYGDVSRMSPEAPIPVCRITNETAMLGGAGNVVRNLVAIGGSVSFISVTGDDDNADDVDVLLRDLAGVTPTLVREKHRPTTRKIRYVAGGQQLLRADREVTTPIPDDIADAIFMATEKELRDAGALILSDYGKGTLTEGLVSRLIEAAIAAGKPVIVDPKSPDFGRYAGATLITPNLKELGEAVDGGLASEENIVNAARGLLTETDIGTMLITRGAQGMSMVTVDNAKHFPSRAREVFDVSGAGDTVLAVLAAGVAAGVPVLEAAQIANVAAGVVVGKTGTAVVYADDLLEELNEMAGLSGSQLPVRQDAALDRIKTWKARGEKVGFTNGCFDLLHPGHVSLLASARATCDRLVVGLNSDASVKRLKGENRPMQNEAARAVVLSSLETVDLVVIFDEDTPEKLLDEVRPDVLVKGGDYTIETVVGADLVQSYGGKVVLAKIVNGFSTTATIERINGT
ncbi:MAG: bifunctional heptose 7-phosphate kinase/heptose 1-phosphate adenyltransferase [Rhodospirillaceae bacterium]|nr:bifunctional heptose 7-phosphate kinase/heptose 1-phosphate adenyltransferase [Rhodospirillaceae bacterium]